MASTNQPNGRPGAMPSWNAAALLNPKGFNPAAPNTQMPSRPAPNAAQSAGPMAFQFSSPGDSAPRSGTVTPTSQNGSLSTPTTTSGMAAKGGMGSMIERMTNLQDRSAVPTPKRRKTEDGQDSRFANVSFGGSSSGILGDYMNKQREQGQGSTSSSVKRVETVDLTSGAEDEVIELDKAEEVCFGMVQGAMVNCHTVPSPKPNMKAFGGPDYWPQVKIVLKRRQGDPTDVIQVYDHTREIIGRIDARTARGIAQLLDTGMLQIRTDCRIPSRRKHPQEVQGQPISCAYKIELMLYGLAKYAKTVGRHLGQRGIVLLSPVRVDPGIRVQIPVPTSTVRPEGKANETPTPIIATVVPRTMEEIRSDVMGLFDSLSSCEELPELRPGDAIQTELLKHQRQALYFMLTREKPRAEYADESHIGSFWQRKVDARSNQYVYHNVITGHTQRQPPAETLGGILADMMGLGKTLSILSLVACSLDRALEWAKLPPVQPPAPRDEKHDQFQAPKAKQFGLTRLRGNSKATLLICPLSTITNWEEQIKQHVKTEALHYHVYHGQNRIKDAETLAKMDLVITTYGSVASELNARSKGKSGPFPLEEVGWFRIVLDEAHMIREQTTLTFKAVCRLQASRRWAVTGTPIQNKLEDLAALLAFLRLKPFDEKPRFVQYIVAPFKVCDPEILPKLRVLVDTVTLRRLKDKIDLPPKMETIVKLDFSPEEQRLYDVFAKNAQDRVQVLTSHGRERIVGGKTYIHILQSILRLRLICAHGRELLGEEDLRTLQGMSQEHAIDLDSDDDDDKPAISESRAYHLFDLMKDTNTDNCVNCNRKLGSTEESSSSSSSGSGSGSGSSGGGGGGGGGGDADVEKEEDRIGYMTPCFHVLCPSCIGHFRDDAAGIRHDSNAYGSCPFCSAHVRFACVELRHTRADVEHEAHGKLKASKSSSSSKMIEGYSGPHTKTRALVEDLLASEAQSAANPDEPPVKSVVFSGWTSHMDLIQIALDAAGIKYTRLDGKMSRPARTAAMDALRDDPTVRVILVSIMAGGLGLNLTAASRVYVMEPQYNPAAEAQAVDRVHRLGQRRAVRTVRYIMRDSFEEKMLELQDKKMKLAKLSMDRADNRVPGDNRVEAAKQRLQDLRSLFK